MIRVFAPFAGIGLLACASGSAVAAPPDYCARFAEEYAEKAVSDIGGTLSAEQVHDRLYHKCLNMDEEPALPTAYAEPEEALAASILKDVVAETPTVDVTAIDEAMVKRTSAVEDDRRPTGTRRTGKWRGSGYAMWSPEWRDWCAEHFPNSFDAETGTIMPYETGVREPCV